MTECTDDPPAARFPPGFLWGTSTSAHQVEGNNRASDWWEYEQQRKLPFPSGDACRHYDLFERDFDLARALGQNAHRLSIEWSRLEPNEGVWNDDALAHYRRVVDALRGRHLEPIVTLHHFTNPAWFLRRGGWSRPDSVALFARYVERIADALGTSVTYWLTLNEPTVYVMESYVLGEWPPCAERAWITAGAVLRNLARAHVTAYLILHRCSPTAKVSFAHNAPVIEPCNRARLADRIAAHVRDLWLNRAFFWLIGARIDDRPAVAHLDFVGLNYYTRSVVRSSGPGLGALVGRACLQPHHPYEGSRSAIGWEIYPQGLASTLARFSAYGLPLLITENGIATDDERLRREYLRRHVAVVAEAIAQGIDVIGYLYWSLIDNFEWAHGTAPHFGLAAIHPETGERMPRPAAAVFARICRENRVSLREDDA